MKAPCIVVQALLLGLASAPSTALAEGAAAPAEAEVTLSILTWNVFLMPGWTHESPDNDARSHAIAVELLRLDYDILVLEKVFDRGAGDILRKALRERYPFQFGPLNDWRCSLKLNGGVFVFSRIPVAGYHAITFRDSADIEIFSRKGAMLLSGEQNGHPFHIVATHLQGDEGSSKRCQRVRNSQLDQIATELLMPFADPANPIFIAGDFVTPRWQGGNVRSETAAYLLMLIMLKAQNGPGARVTLDDDRQHNELASDDTKRQAELDYVLVRHNNHDVRGLWERLILRHPWGSSPVRQDLSYRYAVGAHFRWR